ncbi:ribose-phosphate pyrophosphokinase [Candidatus Uhrbacteria bacterium]|nr:ribose-phosphate pyrophosphokinase [Candidatus Uhrbacteria bacterium]
MNVYTLPNPRPLEISIAKKLDKAFARNTEWRQFTNGEWFLRITKTASSVIVLGRTEPPADNLLQTLLLLDTLKRNGAKKIILVVPYFGYGRQDRVVRNGDHLPADLFLTLFKTCGANRVITVDIHSQATKKSSSLPLYTVDFMPAVASFMKKESFTKDAFTIVSPDHGGRRRADQLRDLLSPSSSVCWLKKIRDPKTGAVHSRELFGMKRGTTALIVDDILDTGGTIAQAVGVLKKHGFTTFYLASTHPIFSARATQTIRALRFKKIVTSNTLPLLSSTQKTLPIVVIDIAQELTGAIMNR